MIFVHKEKNYTVIIKINVTNFPLHIGVFNSRSKKFANDCKNYPGKKQF